MNLLVFGTVVVLWTLFSVVVGYVVATASREDGENK